MTKKEARKLVENESLENQLKASIEFNETGIVTKPKGLTAEELEQFVVKGDLRVLPPAAKARHYTYVCERLGLEPSTKPFDYIVLNGREMLYANKGATDQLRMLHKVSISILTREESDGVYYVYARAVTPDGRQDEDCGAVTVANLKGDQLANAKMKATTKAKRRVTLSILGLGMLDESELETINQAQFAPVGEKMRAVESSAGHKPKWPESDKQEEIASLPIDVGDFIPQLVGFGGEAFDDLVDDELAIVIDAMRDVIKTGRAPTKGAKTWVTNVGKSVAATIKSRATK